MNASQTHSTRPTRRCAPTAWASSTMRRPSRSASTWSRARTASVGSPSSPPTASSAGSATPRAGPIRPAGRLLDRLACRCSTAGPVASHRPRPARCPRASPTTPITRSSASWARGGMGVVYLAQNRLMGRTEVLKVVSSHLINRRGVLDRFLGEIRNAARLHHPNIVTAYSASRARREPRPRDGVRRGPRPGAAGQGQGAAAGGQRLQLHRIRRRWGCSTRTSTAWSTATSSRAT